MICVSYKILYLCHIYISVTRSVQTFKQIKLLLFLKEKKKKISDV